MKENETLELLCVFISIVEFCLRGLTSLTATHSRDIFAIMTLLLLEEEMLIKTPTTEIKCICYMLLHLSDIVEIQHFESDGI